MKELDKRAIFSVDNLKDIVQFGSALKEMGWHIIASAETVKKLKKHGIIAENVAVFTGMKQQYGFPPTLHPKIEVALTQDVPFRIDLVYDIPYSLSKGNDVGGRTLLALGAKGNRIVIFSPEDMELVIKQLKQDINHGSISDRYRRELIDKTNAYIAKHYLTLAQRNDKNSSYYGFIGKKYMRLVNGENPYQVPADLFTLNNKDNLSLNRLLLVNDNIPCFTNLADTDSILFTLCLVAEAFRLKYKKTPYISIAAKHGNPCGMAIDWKSPQKAVLETLFGNPLAIWGGEFITNFKINEDLARLLYKSAKRKKIFANEYWMLDVIIAPDFDKKATKILSKHSSRKLFKNPSLYNPKLSEATWHFRQVRGGFLRQPGADYIIDIIKTEYDKVKFNNKIFDSLIIAWSIAYSSNHGGNEVALVKDNKLLAVGGGPSTVEAAKTAVLRAKANGHNTTKSAFAADAFFPFIDAPRILKKAGCCSGIVPLGGKNEASVKEYFNNNNIAVIYIPSQYRGFCRH